MLLQQQWLFITDFGISKLLSSATYRSQTQAGAGTPEYMAPEQVQGHAIAASDRYSLAMLAYQLFTDALPFRGDTPYATMMMQMTSPLPPARNFNATIPQIVADILARGLAKRPEERPPTCLDFINALELGWHNGQQSAPDPDATLLAPWSKRSYENVPQLPFPEPIFYQSNTQPAYEQAVPSTPFPSSLVTPSTYIQPIPATPSPYPHHVPGYQHNQAAFLSSPNSQTSTVVQYQPESLPVAEPQQRKVGRRAIVLGGAGAVAAATIAGGAFLPPRSLSSPVSAPKPVTKVVPGPQKLISGILQDQQNLYVIVFTALVYLHMSRRVDDTDRLHTLYTGMF